MVRRYSVFASRRKTRPPNIPGSPSNITPQEKEKAIGLVDKALARANRVYAGHIVHGGSDRKRLKDRTRIIQLENEKRSIQNMEPTMPGHVRRAEQSL